MKDPLERNDVNYGGKLCEAIYLYLKSYHDSALIPCSQLKAKKIKRDLQICLDDQILLWEGEDPTITL